MSLQTNLSAFYELENTSWTDALGINDLVGTNTPTVVGGVIGNAVKFASGAGQVLSHADASAFRLGDGNFSFQMWIKVAVPNVGVGLIMSKNDAGGGNAEYRIGTDFNGVAFGACFELYDASAAINTVRSTVNITAGVFQHWVVTWDGSTISIYADAGTANTAAAPTARPPFTSNLFLGKDGASGVFASASQDIVIDLLGFWKNRVLSAAEVTELYNGGAGLSYAAMAGVTPPTATLYSLINVG